MFKYVVLLAGIALALPGIQSLVENFSPQHSAQPAVAANPGNAVSVPGTGEQAQPEHQASYVTGKRTARIAMNPGGHFAADFRINGRMIHGVIDTGATFVAMNVSTARKVGLHPANSDFNYVVSTANGKARAARMTASRMEIGPIDVSDVDVFVMDDTALSDTLIGMSFMSKLGSYRVEGRTLKLEK